MHMKRNIILAAILLFSACAKAPVTSVSDASKIWFDAWLDVNDPNHEWVRTPLGCYIMEDVPGRGAEVLTDTTENHYLWTEYRIYTINKGLANYTDALSARQMNSYREYNYYGPRVWQRGENTMYAGVDDALVGMKEGGYRKFVMPSWLGTYQRYASEDKYMNEVSGTTGIYEVRLVKIIPEIHKWESDSVWNYVHRHYPRKEYKDSIVTGMYYIRTKAPSTTTDMPNDTTCYINYIGRCLDGRVFDTNIRDTAVYYGIWNSSRTYGPVSIKWAEKAEDMKMDGSSSLISGFSATLKQMKPDEAGTGVFTSSWGYATSGSGDLIPPFSPLRFDIELCAAP